MGQDSLHLPCRVQTLLTAPRPWGAQITRWGEDGQIYSTKQNTRDTRPANFRAGGMGGDARRPETPKNTHREFRAAFEELLVG